MQARLLNADNKLCDANGNELVFANTVDTSASDSGYLDPDLDPNADADADADADANANGDADGNADGDADADIGPAIKLEK